MTSNAGGWEKVGSGKGANAKKGQTKAKANKQQGQKNQQAAAAMPKLEDVRK